MKINGIGKDVSDSYVDGRLDRLEQFLAYVQESGYSIAELGISGLSVIINGRLFPQRVALVKDVLARFDLRYTVHAPNRTNLAYGQDHGLERSVLRACIEFCHEIDAHMLVYHSGLQALDTARTGIVMLPGDAAMANGMQQEVMALREIAPVAADADVTVAMENGDPHLWEYVLMKTNDKRADQLPDYHARLRIAPIVDQLKQIDHPNIGITLDLAHLHLATHALNIDYLDAVREAAPYVRHLHMNDNFGKLDVGFDSEKDRLPYGEADLHLPPGWGAIPFADAFACLAGYEGDLILEIKERYWDHFGDALEHTRTLLAEAGATVE